MDNNLINIDDLVRQRLGGGEERERSGAWLRMNELLEKEMPRVRPAGFIWRRLFGGTAILLLLSGLSLGGYELNAYRNHNNGNTNAPVASVIKSEVTTTANNNQNTNYTSPNTDLNTGNTDNKNPETREPNNNNSIPVAYVNNADNKEGNNSKNHKKVIANTGTTDNQHQASVPGVVTGNGPRVAKHQTPGNKVNEVTTNHTPAGNNTKKLEKVARENNTEVQATPPVAAKAGTEVTKPHSGNKENRVADAGKKPSHVNTAQKHTVKSQPVSTEHLALSSGTHTPLVEKTKVVKVHHAPAKTVAPEPTGTTTAALNNHPKTTKSASVSPKVEGKVATGNKPVAGKIAKDRGEKITKSADNKNTSATTAIADNKPAPVVIPVSDKTAKEKQISAEISAVNTQKGKRVIHQLIVFQRLIRTEPKENNYHLDTISIGNITEEYDLAEAIGIKTPKAGNKQGVNELASNNGTEAESNPAINPGAANSTNESAGNKSTNALANHESKGQKALENLQLAFNDIKYKAGNAQFAAGITGGINGTFFGPNSFKGFQFGITGKLTFSDALALMGELKYFNRINNGYTLNDNYYTYNAVAGGYNKVLNENSYSISTLHSIEFPLTARYCIGNFNFFAGGNLVYSFAINTGDYRPDPPAPVFVTATSNDNKAKVDPNDFNSSRFGLGYMFGVSYQVSQKVTLDLRDVQTFWDNSKTEGAKYISSQLYRSPSFQISLGYRIGGNKDKDK